MKNEKKCCFQACLKIQDLEKRGSLFLVLHHMQLKRECLKTIKTNFQGYYRTQQHYKSLNREKSIHFLSITIT